MEVTINELDGKLVATLAGRLDTASATEFEKDIKPLRDSANRDIVLECSDLEYISSSGLRMFLSLMKDVKAAGGTLVIKNISEDLRKIFVITGLFQLFTFE